ncbi:hypothetical protein BJ742DRAFT_779370 [Cladochytrium replicatum]|nr:hypothetical protein BJ742DRAFT_779370 [Cladochytrium replicatum]
MNFVMPTKKNDPPSVRLRVSKADSSKTGRAIQSFDDSKDSATMMLHSRENDRGRLVMEQERVPVIGFSSSAMNDDSVPTIEFPVPLPGSTFKFNYPERSSNYRTTSLGLTGKQHWNAEPHCTRNVFPNVFASTGVQLFDRDVGNASAVHLAESEPNQTFLIEEAHENAVASISKELSFDDDLPRIPDWSVQNLLIQNGLTLLGSKWPLFIFERSHFPLYEPGVRITQGMNLSVGRRTTSNQIPTVQFGALVSSINHVPDFDPTSIAPIRFGAFPESFLESRLQRRAFREGLYALCIQDQKCVRVCERFQSWEFSAIISLHVLALGAHVARQSARRQGEWLTVETQPEWEKTRMRRHSWCALSSEESHSGFEDVEDAEFQWGSRESGMQYKMGGAYRLAQLRKFVRRIQMVFAYNERMLCHGKAEENTKPGTFASATFPAFFWDMPLKKRPLGPVPLVVLPAMLSVAHSPTHILENLVQRRLDCGVHGRTSLNNQEQMECDDDWSTYAKMVSIVWRAVAMTVLVWGLWEELGEIKSAVSATSREYSVAGNQRDEPVNVDVCRSELIIGVETVLKWITSTLRLTSPPFCHLIQNMVGRHHPDRSDLWGQSSSLQLESRGTV